MEELTKLQTDLDKIIDEFVVNTQSRRQITLNNKTYNAITAKSDDNSEIVNYFIDVTDNINSKHEEFLDETIVTMRKISHVIKADIEKLKPIIIESKSKSKWYYIFNWSMGDVKFFIITIIIGVALSTDKGLSILSKLFMFLKGVI